MERTDPSERRDNGLSGKAQVRLGQRQTLYDNWIHRTAIFIESFTCAESLSAYAWKCDESRRSSTAEIAVL
jgi:hypothetical protein